MIFGIYEAKKQDGFMPLESHRLTIDYIFQQLIWGIKEIKRLNELKERFK